MCYKSKYSFISKDLQIFKNFLFDDMELLFSGTKQRTVKITDVFSRTRKHIFKITK